MAITEMIIPKYKTDPETIAKYDTFWPKGSQLFVTHDPRPIAPFYGTIHSHETLGTQTIVSDKILMFGETAILHIIIYMFKQWEGLLPSYSLRTRLGKDRRFLSYCRFSKTSGVHESMCPVPSRTSIPESL